MVKFEPNSFIKTLIIFKAVIISLNSGGFSSSVSISLLIIWNKNNIIYLKKFVIYTCGIIEQNLGINLGIKGNKSSFNTTHNLCQPDNK